MFWDFGSSSRHHTVDSLILCVLVLQMALKNLIWPSKIYFSEKFNQKYISEDFRIFKNLCKNFLLVFDIVF